MRPCVLALSHFAVKKMLEAAHANLATKFVGSYNFQFPFIFFM
jgi:hypothetical protein